MRRGFTTSGSANARWGTAHMKRSTSFSPCVLLIVSLVGFHVLAIGNAHAADRIRIRHFVQLSRLFTDGGCGAERFFY